MRSAVRSVRSQPGAASAAASAAAGAGAGGGSGGRSACAAATIAELKTQKPHETDPGMRPRVPAWCPGGRTMQSALRAFPASTVSTAAMTAPAARRAAAYDPAERRVSENRPSLSSRVGMLCAAFCTSGVNGTGEAATPPAACSAFDFEIDATMSTYAGAWTRRKASSGAGIEFRRFDHLGGR